MARASKRVLTIAPGLPFLPTLARAICAGEVVPGFRLDGENPERLAALTIYVPTRRAVRVLRSEFVTLLGGQSAILPLIRPLGETDDDSGYFDLEPPEILDLAEPLPSTARLLELARLILAWRNRLPEAVARMHPDSPLAAPASPADAVWLARDLSDLIDSIETEERDWDDLRRLDTDAYSAWWQLTAEFLKIASHFWPARLEELKASSSARHRNALLRVEARRLAQLDGKADPVIVAGSTGSVPATAELIGVVAGLQQGAVVLPGLDQWMDDEDWKEVAPLDAEGLLTDPARRSHPQYGLAVLLRKLGLERDDVRPLGQPDADLTMRQRILSAALAPADATSRWSDWRRGLEPDAFERAFSDVGLIEAANEREEAAAIAVALRLALDRPGRHGLSQAALITPDRGLARRVKAELARFGIEADDTAGTPLMATPQGTLTRLVLECTLRPGDPVALISLLKHPLARFGMNAEALPEAACALELLALRGGVGSVDIAGVDSLLDAMLAEQAEAYHVPEWRKSIPPEALEPARALAVAIRNSTAPLTGTLFAGDLRQGLRQQRPLSEWAELTGRVLEAVACCPAKGFGPLWSDEAGAALADLLASIMETDGIIEADGPQWADIMEAFLSGEQVKPRAMSHPRVFIFGTLEARLQSVDTLVLGGLNEGVWPASTSGNPFLSRMMKTGIGLEPPERRTGQHAHDFEMANGTRHLIYSRSARIGTAPAVASRWLQRLLALGGKDFAEGLRRRASGYCHWAGLLDAGERQEPATRPDPRPPAALQPKSYSFSEVGRLRRDPYAIYARRILRLDPLDGYNTDPGAAERGTLYHRIVDRFVREGHRAGYPEASAAMGRIIEEEFDRERLPAHVDAVWRPRFAEVAASFLEWQAERDRIVEKSITEVRARFDLPALGISVTGVADRIDIKPGGVADIIDYKTGSSPSTAQARSLLDPQLPLEAAALMGGAFRQAGVRQPDDLLYVRLRPGTRFKAEVVNNEKGKVTASTQVKSAPHLAAESLNELSRFVSVLQTGQRGFMSRLIPASAQDYGGEYDHLARVAEWATAEGEEEAGDE
ncbi:double-strand break repair protein AddB [Gellertiella hungarica]|uniref:ATP-dependent helicase/nuclease subunit B n=1 Tax=Gellertiella hungarica TaxID=1572859 RepID=A0A7W6NMQ9_9HYPH|nr:double-strand break repair protein AddB [Gellertiella hungarica]MBB4066879.1 ATP-dependent helicase/nuclease subunit B [Gellertiella hungarica]